LHGFGSLFFFFFFFFFSARWRSLSRHHVAIKRTKPKEQHASAVMQGIWRFVVCVFFFVFFAFFCGARLPRLGFAHCSVFKGCQRQTKKIEEKEKNDFRRCPRAVGAEIERRAERAEVDELHQFDRFHEEEQGQKSQNKHSRCSPASPRRRIVAWSSARMRLGGRSALR
jgi:hypothetical protein